LKPFKRPIIDNTVNQQKYPGARCARWWKFDFHAHTLALNDFMKGCPEEDKEKVTPQYWLQKYWLQKFIEKKIDCVAITDHNCGEWIDKLTSEIHYRTDLKKGLPKKEKIYRIDKFQ